jgi:hypothetical protein
MRLRTLTWLLATLWISGTAHAAPVELLDAIDIVPGKPDSLLLRYRWGNGGMFLSDDGGKSFSMICNGFVDGSLRREASAAITRSDGSILLGTFDGMWRGTADGCTWASVPMFAGKWVNDFVYDPRDPDRVYTITSSGGQQNGVYVNELGSDEWKPVGGQDEVLINRLHVVKLGKDGLRIYQSIVRGEILMLDADGGIADRAPNYIVRYSDDLGETWTEHEFGKTDATVRLLAVDPTDPERIVVGLLRDPLSGEAALDELLWSDAAGEPDSFTKLGEVETLGGLSFAPDGRLFYGDHDQDSPALYAVAKLGDAPKTLSTDFKVGCVRYDTMTDSLYVCQDTVLGKVDPNTGAFSEVYDIKQADQFAKCGAEGELRATCKSVLLVNFCNITHYYCAPLCADYEVRDLDGQRSTESKLCGADGGVPTGAADSGTSKSTDASTEKPASTEGDGGCNVTHPAARGTSPLAWLLLCTGLVLTARRRRGAR